ncbi:MAG: PH domain-containing protein [Gemmatimonadota bacterium]
MAPEQTLYEASFHPKLRLYLYLQGVVVLVATVVGLPLLPIWLVVGWWWAGRYLDHLSCALGPRSLVVKKGIQFRTEKTIPLDKIQDISVRHGPLLNWLGLAKLSVETAGQGSPQGAAVALTGIVDATAFRDRVLEQRDRLEDGESVAGRRRADAAGTAGHSSDPVPLLREIRDSLGRIEEALRARSGGG